VLDIGVVRMIREKRIRVFGGVDRFVSDGVVFRDGRQERFDAVIAGIGYECNHADMVDAAPRRFEDLRVGSGRQRYFGEDGLYF